MADKFQVRNAKGGRWIKNTESGEWTRLDDEPPGPGDPSVFHHLGQSAYVRHAVLTVGLLLVLLIAGGIFLRDMAPTFIGLHAAASCPVASPSPSLPPSVFP